MGVRSWLGRLLKDDTDTIGPLSVYRLETPQKVIETKIHPVKLPTVVDIGGRLALLLRDVSYLKKEMASKTWFMDEFQDQTPAIINLLNKINENLRILLSKFTKNTIPSQPTDIEHFSGPFNTSEFLLKIIKSQKKARYRDIKKQIPVSDPTLSKYLKILVSDKKIRRIKVGKAVFYEAI